MPETTIIDEMAVRFTTDTADMARGIEQGMDEAKALVEAGAQEIEAAFTDAFELIPEEMKRAVSDAINAMTLMGLSADQAAEAVAEAYGVMADDVIENVEIMFGMIDQMVEQQMAAMREFGAQGGVVFTAEEEATLRSTLQARLALNASIAETSEEMKTLNNELVNEREILLENIKAEREISRAVEITKQGYAALGEEIPIEELDKLITRLQNVYILAKQSDAPMEQLRDNLTKIAQDAVPQTNVALNKMDGVLGKVLGSVGGLVIGMVSIQKVIQFFKESIALATQGIEETTKLTLAVREHQRSVGELAPTVAEANAQVARLSETYGINISKSRQLVTESLQMTNNLKLTTAQLESMQESAVILGEVMGVDVVRSMQILTDFMTTGHTAALEQLGFTLDENSLRVEAIQRGYISYGEAMDEATEREIGLLLVEERSQAMKDDLIEANSEIAGQIKAQNEALNIQKELLGKFLLPFWENFKLLVTTGMTALTQVLTMVVVKGLEGLAKFSAEVDAVIDTWKIFADEGFSGIAKRGGFTATREAIVAERTAENLERVREVLQGAMEAGTEMGDEHSETLSKTTSDWEEFADKVTGAADAYALAMKDIQQSYDRDFLAAQNRLNDDLAKIDAQFDQRRKQAGLNLAHSLDDINRNARQRKETATLNHYNETERALADHQLRMRRLEEDYIFNLQDAVRERDARAVLDLRRRYNMDKKRAEEDFKIRNKRRKEDLALELAQIEAQRILKRNQRIEAFNEEIAQLAEQEDLKKQAARDAFDKKIEDLNTKYGEQLKQEGAFLAESLGLNAEHAEELYKLLESMYGETGFVKAFIDGISEYLAGANLVLPGVTGPYLSGVSNPDNLSQEEMRGRSAGVTRQRGGTLFATSPTMLTVGETPERVDITRMSASTGGQRDGARGGDPIQINLSVDADEGLKVEVADFTMSEIAEVFVTIDKKATGQVRRN